MNVLKGAVCFLRKVNLTHLAEIFFFFLLFLNLERISEALEEQRGEVKRGGVLYKCGEGVRGENQGITVCACA